MSHAISVRLPENLTQALEKVAEAVDRPKTFLIRKEIVSFGAVVRFQNRLIAGTSVR